LAHQNGPICATRHPTAITGERDQNGGSAQVLTEIPITQRDVSCRFRPPTQYSDDWSGDAAPGFIADLMATAWPRWPNPPPAWHAFLGAMRVHCGMWLGWMMPQGPRHGESSHDVGAMSVRLRCGIVGSQ